MSEFVEGIEEGSILRSGEVNMRLWKRFFKNGKQKDEFFRGTKQRNGL
jgi:hypothetical protein